MDVIHLSSSYDSYGANEYCSLLGDLLETHPLAATVGIDELVLVSMFSSQQVPKKGSWQHERHVEFHAKLERLPQIIYSPKKRKLSIDYYSPLSDASVIGSYDPIDFDLFTGFAHELQTLMHQWTPALSKKKGLDVQALLAWVDQAVATAPTSPVELERFKVQMLQAAASARATQSPWEQLGVDWDEFHPDARSLLDDPFFWDGHDDYSPHGNDTGADVLSELREPGACRRSPATFLEWLFKRWDMHKDIERALHMPVDALDDEALLALKVHDQAVVGLAFGYLKLRGAMPAGIAEQALQTFRRRRAVCKAKGYPVSDELQQAWCKLEAKLGASE
ncbi:MAG: hypothetical protein Q4G62_03390 [Pseudomonadota bacterium]|nr:hypothetical protein [Pseudomonadota bacterium]